MKKKIALLLATIMVFGSLTACGNSSVGTKKEAASKVTTINGKPLTKIGLSAPAMDNEFMTNLKESLEKTAKENGVKVLVSEAEQSSSKQVEQIENMITSGCEAICVSPVDLNAILDCLKHAKESGVTISLCGVVPDSKDYYDVVANVEQYDLGKAAAQAAADWINKTFPDAPDKSIEVAVLALNNSGEAIKRESGLKAIEELCPKAKIVEEYDSTGASSIPTKAQEYAEMMFVSHPDVKCVLTYSDFMGLAANEVAMKNPNLDKSKFGIFGCDYSEAGSAAIEKSKTNDSVYRASGAFGVTFGKTMFDTVVGNVDFDDLGVYYEPAFILNDENVDQYKK